jgi:hypothetical protein
MVSVGEECFPLLVIVLVLLLVIDLGALIYEHEHE